MQIAQVKTFERLDLNAYGYGLAIVENLAFPNASNQLQAYADAKLVWHGGEIPGYRAHRDALAGFRIRGADQRRRHQSGY